MLTDIAIGSFIGLSLGFMILSANGLCNEVKRYYEAMNKYLDYKFGEQERES